MQVGTGIATSDLIALEFGFEPHARSETADYKSPSLSRLSRCSSTYQFYTVYF